MEAIEKRWAVRYFLPRPVEREKIDAMVDAARSAPSWKNQKCARLVIVDDVEVIHKLVDSGAIPERNGWMGDAPVLIVAVSDPEKSGHYNGMDYYLVDTAIAVTILQIAAVSLGLGSCWTGIFDEDKVKDILNIPANMKVVTIMPVGYPDWDRVMANKKRVEMHRDKLPRNKYAYHNRFGQEW